METKKVKVFGLLRTRHINYLLIHLPFMSNDDPVFYFSAIPLDRVTNLGQTNKPVYLYETKIWVHGDFVVEQFPEPREVLVQVSEEEINRELANADVTN